MPDYSDEEIDKVSDNVSDCDNDAFVNFDQAYTNEVIPIHTHAYINV